MCTCGDADMLGRRDTGRGMQVKSSICVFVLAKTRTAGEYKDDGGV